MVSYILPVERETEHPQPLVVDGPTEEICKYSRLVAGGVHCGQARNGDGVQPREDVGGEELIEEHEHETIPEPSKRLGVLQVLPMESLKSLHGRKITPIDCIDVPDSYGSHDARKAVPKKPN
jgi:hypothetical protein